jgi:parallel beta-helix repeat protein
MNRKTAVILVACVGLIAAWGPLDPPNGPIAPTYKTLSEVEPRIALSAENTPGDSDSVFRVLAAGSYYLTGPLTVPSGKSGIEVAGSNVTIDLNGFRLLGQIGSLDGIHANGDLSGVTVRNGGIVATRGDGIDASDCTAMRIERVTVTGVTGQGIAVGGSNEVAHCIVRNSGSHGINTGDECRVADCTASDNGGIGIDVDNGCSVRDCIASGNATSGFSANAGCTFAGCAASDNLGIGFTANELAVLTDCSASNNAGIGFEAVARTRLTRCVARGNTNGFLLTEANSAIECTAASNQNNGFRIEGNANTIERCTAHENDANGIFLYTGVGNNIDGNAATFNDGVGVYLNDAGNIAVRNRARGNVLSNYSFADNDYGVILASPGQGFASSAAWANFAY